MKNNKRLMRFCTLEFFFWATFATYYPYLIIFLDSKGLDNIQIGTILGINSFIAIFAQPFWGMVSDRMQSIKKVFIILLSIAVILIGSLPFYEGVILLGIIFVVITFFETALAPLLDGWIIMSIQSESEISYGTIRLWGSLGFALMVYIFGQLIEIKGVWILYVGYAFLGIITIFLCSRVNVDDPIASKVTKNLKISRLFKNYDYSAFLVFAMVLFIPHRAAFIFLPRVMDAVGGNKVHLGIALSTMALSEVPIFLFSKKFIYRVKPIYILLFSTIFFILRQILFYIASSPIHIILIQMLQGFSFALFLTGAVYYMDSLAPQELKATAQTVGSAVFIGMSGISGSYGGGWIIENYGIANLYYTGIYISVGITILYSLSMYFRKNKSTW
ncbi:MFS transporter [Marinisporobacter balticus]|uniref:PPP family 3-phenylpropionic acid transporter n=1 Tax=Marinisporobacter balticus TaxID=2018667 RepID=A0A4R2KYQ3_9FIRM|nr:MFS transporter [Marinisporobacter balticus]TCO78037.1 PPP family 3-phenylpropionic acid transporter [Marinisporobacter balticus]